MHEDNRWTDSHWAYEKEVEPEKCQHVLQEEARFEVIYGVHVCASV